MQTQSSSGANIDASQTGTLGAIYGVITNGAITLSSTLASSTATTVTISFNSVQSIPSSGMITTDLVGFAWPAAPVCTFNSPSALANSAAFAANTLTVTLNAGVQALAAAIVFSCTGMITFVLY